MRRLSAKSVRQRQKFVLTPMDGGDGHIDIVYYLNGLPFEQKWEVLYESAADTVSVSQASVAVAGTSTQFTSHLGDVWIGFGANPSKFYKIEAVHSNTALQIEHPLTEASITGSAYTLVRPKRFLVEYEPGNYDVYISSGDVRCRFTAPICVTFAGQSTDAQLFYDSNSSLQGLFHGGSGFNSGEIGIKRLSLHGLFASEATNFANTFLRMQTGNSGDIANVLVERCRVNGPYMDNFLASNTGTVIVRHNEGYVGYDGLAVSSSVDKFYAYGNIIRSHAPYSNHGKTGFACIANVKGGAGGPGTRQAWIHNNIIDISNFGADSTVAGISFKISSDTGMPGAMSAAKLVSQNNYIRVGGDTTAALTGQGGVGEGVDNGLVAGIVSWGSTHMKSESHGDVIDLHGGSPNGYGYASQLGRLDIWRRPDSYPVLQQLAGTAYEDGVLIP